MSDPTDCRLNLDRAPSGPAHIKSLQERFRSALYTRFRDIRGWLREHVGAEDGLGLSSPADLTFSGAATRLSQFMDEAREVIERHLRQSLPPERVRQGHHYSGTYIRGTYQRGGRFANRRLREEGYSLGEFSLATAGGSVVGVAGVGAAHQAILRGRLQQTYYEISGMADDVERRVQRISTQAVEEGWSKREAADRLTDAVDSVYETSGRQTVRYETMRAFVLASLQQYKDSGIEAVEGVTEPQAEVLTARDIHVCPECRALGGNRYSVDKAREILPAHPGCRCVFIPVIT
jgi:SPP1 gp7 family putative phage head morphogenesis protein